MTVIRSSRQRWTSSSRLLDCRTANARACAKGERLLRTVGGKRTTGVFGFHDSAGRETPAQNPGRVDEALQPGPPSLSLGPGIPEPAAVFLPLQGHDRHSLAQDLKVVARAVLGGPRHEYQWERIAA